MIFSQNANNIAVADAEHGDLVAGDAFYWGLVADGASGQALQPTGQTWDKTLAGYADYTFKLTTGGSFNLFFYLNTHGREGKIWVELDGQLNAVGPNDNGRLYFHSSGYSWQNGYDNALVVLSAGTHKLRIRSLTKSVILDRVAIVPQGSTHITVGMTSIGPAETGTGTAPTVEKTDTYLDWLMSERGKKTLLVDLYRSDGVTHLGSRPYLSELNEAHSDLFINPPSMEYSLVSLVDGIGDIEAYYPDYISEDWKNKDWRGYRCEWRHGDVSWNKSDYRLIASATIESMKILGPRQVRFELVGDVMNYNRTYASSDLTQTQDVRDLIEWICTQGGAEKPEFLNMDDGEQDVPARIDVTDSSIMYTDIKLIAGSVGAYPRVNQLGKMEIIKPDTDGEPTITLTNDIELGTVQETDYIPAYKRVRVTYGVDSSVSGETTANTGSMDDEIVIETALANTSDANDRLAIELDRHAKPQRLWSMNVFNLTAILREGDYVAIDHDELKGAGVVLNLKPSLDSARGNIEVLI